MAEQIPPTTDYRQQVAAYERKRKIYGDTMRLWEMFDKTSSEMDARFDKVLFTIAAGSFGLSFVFIDKFVPVIGKAVWPLLLMISWALFALCLIVMVIGHLMSAESWRKQRDQVAKDMFLQFDGKPVENKPTKDSVSPCNYIALISYIGGIVCLLWFVLINL